MSELTIFTDGGSRGNPGPAASAYVVVLSDKIIESGSLYLGVATNNFAEYKGVIIALDRIKQNYESRDVAKINFFLDSELVVRQLNKIYKVKSPDIKKLFDIVTNLINTIPCEFSFTSIPREQNKEADRLVNETLDRENKV